MKNFVSPHVHIDSLDSASTPKAFIEKEIALGTGAITVTDHGTLQACRLVYDLAKKGGYHPDDKEKKNLVKLTPILGLEGYLRDDDCPILTAAGVEKKHPLKKNKEPDTTKPKTFAHHLKYMHFTVHFLDQAAFQAGIRLLSRAPVEKHGSESKPLFNWTDLEELGSHNVTMTSGCLIGVVQRHLMQHSDMATAVKYYEKYRSLVKPGNFYVEAFPHVCDRYWEQGVYIKVNNGDGMRERRYYDKKKLKTNAGELEAAELVKAFSKKDNPHQVLIAEMNNRKWDDFEPVRIYSVERREGFLTNECRPWAPDGDYQKGCNEAVIRLARKYGDKILISDDAHFAGPEFKVAQDIRLQQSGGWRFHTSYHRLSSEDAWKYFDKKLGVPKGEFEGWIENSYEWRDKFKNFSLKNEVSLPRKFYPSDTVAHLKTLIRKHGRMNFNDDKRVARLREEIQLFHDNGTVDLLPYFFLAEEVCALYEEKGELTGPGRGSAAGCLITYLLGITHKDPLRYDLSLERFLTLDRIKSGAFPDIDMDFPSRDILVDEETGWLKKRFGNHYAQISTQTLLRLKSAARDVARVKMGGASPALDALIRKFEEPPQGVSDHDFVFGYEDSGNFQQGSIDRDEALIKYTKQYPEHWEIVRKVLALSRSKGRHASAYVIADQEIEEFIPTTNIGGFRCTAWTMQAVEAAGGVKMDFLVINSLNDLSEAIKLVQKRAGVELPKSIQLNGLRVPRVRVVPHRGQLLDIWDLPADQVVLTDIAEGRTETVFQFNTGGATKWLRQFVGNKPDGTPIISKLEDLAAFTALDRPGPLDMMVVNPDDGSKHNLLVEYARRAQGQTGSPDILPMFDQLLPETYGVMCIAAGSLVRTSLGMVPIEQVTPGTLVQTESGALNPVLQRLDRGVRECVRVLMDGGEALVLTEDHRVLTQRGWVEAGQLMKTDLVAQHWISDERIETGDDRDWVIGLLLADGDLTASTPTVACESEAFAGAVKTIADKAWGLDCVVVKYGRTWYCRLRHRKSAGTTPNPLTRFLRDEGLLGLDYATKHFPSRLTTSMLAGFFEGDGSTLNQRLRVKNERLARRFFEGLQALRIPSSLRSDDGVWTVSVQGQLPLRIKTQRTLRGGYVPRPCLSVVKKSDGERYYNHKRSTRPFISRRAMNDLASAYDLATDSRPWGRVLSIKPVGKRRVYDLSVENEHSFVAGGSVVHNCYQEQLQRMYQQLTGCTLADAESFRRDIAKKKMDKVLAVYPTFIEKAGAILGQENAEAAWEFMKTWANYGFNKAHAICYSDIGYACAFLKHHYPLEWWAAVLSNATKAEVSSDFWRYVRDFIDLPDVTKSGATFEIHGNRLQAPVSLLHGIGEAAHTELLAGMPYRDVRDFCDKIQAHREKHATFKTETKVKEKKRKNKKTGEVEVIARTMEEVIKKSLGPTALNSRVVSTLIVSGAMDGLFPKGTDVPTMLKQYVETLEEVEALAAGKENKHKEKVDAEFLNLSGLDRFVRRKAILPAYSEPLLPLISDGSYENIFVEDDNLQYKRKKFFCDIKPASTFDLIERTSPEVSHIAIVGYVEDVRDFNYGEGKKNEARALTLDIDGMRREFVRWPERDSGKLPGPFKEMKLKGAVVVAVLARYRGDKPFSLDDVEVLRAPIGTVADPAPTVTSDDASSV